MAADPPSAGDFDNWKDYAEAGMAYQAATYESETLDRLLERARTEHDGILWKAIAKKGDRPRGLPVLLEVLKLFAGDEAGDDSMRFYALEAIYLLAKLSKRPEEDELFLALFTKPGGQATWEADYARLQVKVARFLRP